MEFIIQQLLKYIPKVEIRMEESRSANFEKMSKGLNTEASEFKMPDPNFENGMKEEEEDMDMIHELAESMDGFYPEFKDCSCCFGMPYSCKGVDCVESGFCLCMIDQNYRIEKLRENAEQYMPAEPVHPIIDNGYARNDTQSGFYFYDEEDGVYYDDTGAVYDLDEGYPLDEPYQDASMASNAQFADNKDRNAWFSESMTCGCCKGFNRRCGGICGSNNGFCYCAFPL